MPDQEMSSNSNPLTGDSADGKHAPPAKSRHASGARHPLIELTFTRLREFIREPEAVFWVFVFPILLSIALGIAFRSSGSEVIRIAIDSGPTGESQERARLVANSISGNIQATILTSEEAARAMRTGRVALIVKPVHSDSFNEKEVEYIFDPSRPESNTARIIVDDAIQRGAGRADVTKVSDSQVTESGARYIDFLIPGLIGMNLMGNGMWGLGFAVVVARNRKLLKRLAATPMRRSHYLLSFMFSRLFLLVPEVGIIVGFSYVVFDVRVAGSLLDLFLVSLAGAFAFAGLGLLVASRPETIEGVSGLMNFVMLPMWLLSGTFFSWSRFPEAFHPAIKALPLTALNDALRIVMNEGLSLSGCWMELLILVLWTAVSFALALKIFKWQ